MDIKLNLGASPIWQKEGWHVLDHKLKETDGFKIAGDAANMDLPDESCDIVFCSHVFEHIPHTRLPLVISEINRVLKVGGVFRILTPDLKKVATAYVNSDQGFFEKAKKEDPSLRTDLGLGGMFMNFIVSPGQDTILLNRGVTEFIAGYAHLYSYDFSMLATMLNRLGFEKCQEPGFCVSQIEEMNEPYHVDSLPAIWQEFNPEFYKKNNLQHELIEGTYHINFKVTGFDRDPLTSLIIECEKKDYVSRQDAHKIFNLGQDNYNRYAYSLLKDPQVSEKLNALGLASGSEV
jgi:SAM-dependent methyltransferase